MNGDGARDPDDDGDDGDGDAGDDDDDGGDDDDDGGVDDNGDRCDHFIVQQGRPDCIGQIAAFLRPICGGKCKYAIAIVPLLYVVSRYGLSVVI